MKITYNNSCDGFYKNSLDVRFTNICDNNCPFCIEKSGVECMPLDIDKMIESTIKSGRKEILILGGEPLLQLRAVKTYIEGIREYVDKIYITTSLPRTILSDLDTFTEIFNLIDGLNVSLQHFNPDKNNEIMCASSNHDRIHELKEICELERRFNPAVNKDTTKIRVSINLVKGAIDNKKKIKKFLKTMQDIGVRHVKINELQHTPDLYISFEKAYNYNKLESPYAHGCQGEIELKKFSELKITLKRACFMVEPSCTSTKADYKKYIKKKKENKKSNKFVPGQVVLYENGMLSKGWLAKAVND